MTKGAGASFRQLPTCCEAAFLKEEENDCKTCTDSDFMNSDDLVSALIMKKELEFQYVVENSDWRRFGGIHAGTTAGVEPLHQHRDCHEDKHILKRYWQKVIDKDVVVGLASLSDDDKPSGGGATPVEIFDAFLVVVAINSSETVGEGTI